MKNNVFVYIGSVVLISLLLVSCDPENPNNPNEQEVITNVSITAISSADTVYASYSDPDGNGGNVPTIDTLHLLPATTYTVFLNLLDETKSPVDTVTHEIESEGEAHQFFFAFTGVSVTSVYGDTDGNGHPIGLHSSWTTAAVQSGSVMVTLRHQPDKSASGVSSGNITNAGGETDIEVSFPIVVQ